MNGNMNINGVSIEVSDCPNKECKGCGMKIIHIKLNEITFELILTKDSELILPQPELIQETIAGFPSFRYEEERMSRAKEMRQFLLDLLKQISSTMSVGELQGIVELHEKEKSEAGDTWFDGQEELLQFAKQKLRERTAGLN